MSARVRVGLEAPEYWSAFNVSLDKEVDQFSGGSLLLVQGQRSRCRTGTAAPGTPRKRRSAPAKSLIGHDGTWRRRAPTAAHDPLRKSGSIASKLRANSPMAIARTAEEHARRPG